MVTKLDVQLVETITKQYDEKRFHDVELYYGNDDNSRISKDILFKKYLEISNNSDEPGEDCLFDMWTRLAWGNAQAEKEDQQQEWASKYFGLLADFKFIPGGRINYGLGRGEIKVSFSNCYVLPIKNDSLESIYECLFNEAKTYKSGGGCGHDLSILRPKDSPILGTGGESCGPIGFMDLFSGSTNTVRQNNRRGANMQTIDVSHPDIEEFVSVKNEIKTIREKLIKLAKLLPKHRVLVNAINKHIESTRKVQHSNISIKLTDEFMEAVNEDLDFDLRWGGKVYRTIKAKELWNKIVKTAWESAEPGLIFWDRMVENNNLEYINPLLSTNPCSELPLGAFGNCLLGHMNLSKFIKSKSGVHIFDYEDFEKSVRLAVRFLDNVVTLNDGRHPLKEQNEVALNERRIGLGITGLGDALILLGIQYGSDECIEFLDNKVMPVFRDTAYDQSCDLAVEKGAFPWFESEGFFQSKFAQNMPLKIKDKIKSNGIRNGMLLTCAPVGTGSIIAQTSSGIEPIFRCYYIRKIKDDDAIFSTEYKIYHPLLKSLFLDKEKEIPDYVVDSSQIKPEERVKVQAIIQKYIDNSISSTVNLPKSATEQDVSKVYMTAWKSGCKGITVYREGSREGVLLSEEEYIASLDGDSFGNEEVKTGVSLKRPAKLQGETFRIRTDTGKGPVNCYYTINFFKDTNIPYELFINESPNDKDMKDVLMLELATRCTSMMLRHQIPLEFIVEQFEKIQNQYVYSIPINIAKVLKNYVKNGHSASKCPSCGSANIKHENGCFICADCGDGKCS